MARLTLLFWAFILWANASAQSQRLRGNPTNVSHPFHMNCASTKLTTDGGHIHTGSYWAEINPGYWGHKIYLMKTDAAGATSWMKVFDIPETVVEDPAEVIQTSDGGYAIVGQALNIYSATTFDMDVFILKTTSNGTLSWYNRYGSGSSHELGYSIIELRNQPNKFAITGSVYTGGRITSIFNIYNEFDGVFDPHVNTELKHVMVMKVDGTSFPAGQVVWSNKYEPLDNLISKESEGYKILELETQELVLCGVYGAGYPAGGGGYISHEYPIIYKLSSLGNVLWSKIYKDIGYNNISYANALSMTSLGSSGFALTGYSDGAMLFKTDVSGNVSWSKHLQGSNISHDLIFNGNNLHAVGYSFTTVSAHTSNSKYLYIRSDLSGNKLIAKHYGKATQVFYGSKNMTKQAAAATRSGGYAFTGHILDQRATSLGDMFYVRPDANGNTLFTNCEETNTRTWADLNLTGENLILTVTPEVIQRYTTTQPLVVATVTPAEKDVCQAVKVSKFRDNNVNGVHDAGEPLIGSWPIEVTPTGGTPTLYYTAANGEVLVPDVPATIRELNLPWYIPISPSSGSYTYTGGTPPAGGYKFGNYKCPNMCETVSDMIAYLHMEETSLNGGNPVCNLVNTNGTVTSGGAAQPTSVTGPAGNGNAIKFNNGEKISIPHYSEMDFGSGSFSADAYIKLSSVSSKQVIVSQMGTSGGNPKGWSFFVSNYNQLGFERQNGFGGSYTWTPAGTGWFTPNTWYHVAFVYDGTANTMTFYVNGAVQTGMGYGWWNYQHDNTGAMVIGDNALDGAIDEVSVYNRALTTSEISAIYTKGKCRDYITITPVNNGCQSGQVNATYTAKVYNGNSGTCNYKFALSGLPSGGSCNVNGPKDFVPSNGSFTLSGCGSSTSFNFDVPCNSTYTPGNTGCFALTVWNQTAGRCNLEESKGTSLNQYKNAVPQQEPILPQAIITDDGSGPKIVLEHFDASSPAQATAYPNPFTDNLNLTVILSKDMDIDVSVLDVYGRTAISNEHHSLPKGQHDLAIKGGGLVNGVYIVRVIAGTQEIYIRVMKQH